MKRITLLAMFAVIGMNVVNAIALSLQLQLTKPDESMETLYPSPPKRSVVDIPGCVIDTTTDEMTITASGEIYSVTVTSVQGVICFHEVGGGDFGVYQLPDMPCGVYTIEAEIDGSTYSADFQL